MDSISVKLLHRNYLIKENMSLGNISNNLAGQVQAIQDKASLYSSQSLKYKSLFDISEAQKNAALESLEAQKIITKNVKAKARKNGLLYFGGGLSIGFLVFAVLVD